jgi:hypothetical protein
MPELLEQLKTAIASGSLRREDVLAAIGETETQKQGRHFNVQTVLTIIGGLIVLTGIATYIGQFWSGFSDVARVVITLGPAAAVLFWVHFMQTRGANRLLLRVLLLIPALLMPTGFHVMMRMLEVEDGELAVTLNALLNLAIFLGFWLLQREPLLYYLSVISGSVAYVAGTEMLVEYDSGEFRAYRLIALGIALLAFGRDAARRAVPGQLIDFAGASFALASVFYLAVERDQTGWLFIYPLLLGLAFWSAVRVQSRVLVAAGAIFTIIYTTYLSNKFFSETVGWPFAVIVAGIAIMATGRFSWQLGRTLRRKT